MDAFTISAASGMRARLESLEMIANNLANQSSPGFKPDREMYGLYVAAEAQWPQDESAVSSPAAPVIERHWTDFKQGSLSQTGETFDVALNGPGFFATRSERGELLTRNGNFKLTPGGILETQDGYAVLDDQRRPIQLNPDRAVEISRQGEIRQEGVPVARLAVATVPDPQSLNKQAGTYFLMTDTARFGAPGGAEVFQGRLENSSHAPAEGAVRLVNVLRQFESLTKAVQIHAEMNRRADDVARVTG
jgi:flagellar basal-body rod protein FlgF